MPNHFAPFVNGDDDALHLQEVEQELQHKQSRKASFLKGIGSFWRRQQQRHAEETSPQLAPSEPAPLPEGFPRRHRSLQDSSTKRRRAIPSLPRPQTFHRQESERRERLEPALEEHVGRRRALSASAARRVPSPPIVPFPSLSAPEVTPSGAVFPTLLSDEPDAPSHSLKQSRDPRDLPPLSIPDPFDGCRIVESEEENYEIDAHALQEEYEQRWILNLSMHFRDKSNREKFFVTYAETPSRWRRITVSLDYRVAPKGSLEADLSTLHYQRDKSFRIYEAIRESLPDIQYYDTVTNLKLETTPEDGQLHVHVREDANEIVNFPNVALFQHVQTHFYTESEVEFISHLSGFVYKVRAGGRTVIKKEIPGPDTVDEFLYEVNALDSLHGCDSVIQLQGLVTDDSGMLVKGLLISYASQGALVDMLYDYRGELPWHRRERWAKQIVQGLSDIHEAGFVQGDFTLSNIVINEEDDAQIIDINRRGCPVGWEPPELGRLIDSGQRISMCIGVKTDLFQLGMVLWALAEEVDEPERIERPHPSVSNAPSYFQEIVEICLSERPQGRWAANRLLRLFPTAVSPPSPRRRPSVDCAERLRVSDNSVSTHRSDKEYIDPDMAITLDEVRRRRANSGFTDFTSGQVTYVDPDSNAASTSYHFESSGSWIVGRRRGRSPVSSKRRPSSPMGQSVSSKTSVSSIEPARRCRPCDSEDEACGGALEMKVPASAAWGPPAEIPTKDVELPNEVGYPDDIRTREEGTPRPVAEMQVDGLRGDEVVQLLHTDSGFDEKMMSELRLDDAGAGRRTAESGGHDVDEIRQS